MAGSIVQQWGAENGAAGTTLATGSATVTSGNFLVIQTNSDTAVTCTITKNAGTATIGTITEQTSVTEAATFETTKTYTCSITGSGTLDLLATFGASDANRMVFAWEISGVDSYFGSQAQTDTGNNPTTTCTVTSVTAPAFAFMACIDMQGGTPGVGSGYTNYNTFGGTVHNGRAQYKAVSTNGSVTGNFANAGFDRNNAVLVIFTEPAPPAITVQPVQQTVASGATATFSVTATGATSYQWQINSAGSWTNVSTGTGGTTSSYTTGTLGTSDIGNLYRCQVTNAAGTVNTAEVFVFLTNQPSASKGRRLSSTWLDHKSTSKGYTNPFIQLREYSRAANAVNPAASTAWNTWWFDAVASGVSGTLSYTNANDTSSAVGTTTVLGSLARTNANDTSAASGTTAVVGTLASTNANDTSAASGNPVVAGSSSTTNANDTLAASGSVGSSVEGTLAYTNNNDTSSGAGNTTVLGTLSRTNNNDTSTASGSPVVNGTLARTNTNDTSSASGTTAVVGSLSTTNANDTLAASGSAGSTPSGTVNYTNQNDTLSAQGTSIIQGTLARTNNNDTLAAFGTAGTPGSGITTRLPMTGVGS